LEPGGKGLVRGEILSPTFINFSPNIKRETTKRSEEKGKGSSQRQAQEVFPSSSNNSVGGVRKKEGGVGRGLPLGGGFHKRNEKEYWIRNSQQVVKRVIFNMQARGREKGKRGPEKFTFFINVHFVLQCA